MELTNEQWRAVAGLLPPEKVRADGRGRPWRDQRTVFNGVLWVLRTGAPWKDLPPRYGSYRKRWKIERLFAWLFSFRRLVVRYEHHAQNFQGFLHLPAVIIPLETFMRYVLVMPLVAVILRGVKCKFSRNHQNRALAGRSFRRVPQAGSGWEASLN